MGSGVKHWQILAHDRTSLSAFYEKMFGWKISANDEMDVSMVAAATNGIPGNIIGAADKFGVRIVVDSENAESDVAKISGGGGTMTEDVRQIGEMAKVGRFTEPGGVEMGLFQRLGATPFDGLGESDGSAVIHFEIQSADGDKSQTFLSETFGWTINADNPMNYGLAETGGGGINGGVLTAEGLAGTVVYAEVDDPQAALDRAVSLKGSIAVPVTEIPDMVTFGIFTDPEGNAFGVVKSDH